MSLCTYGITKRTLVENGDAAPFGKVPKLLDGTDYTLYCTRVFFISRQH